MLEIMILVSSLLSVAFIGIGSVQTTSYKEKVVLCSEIEDSASKDACLNKVIKEDVAKPVKGGYKTHYKGMPESNQE